MRSIVACLVVFGGVVAATTASAQNTAATDVYHVHFTKAAPGQAAALAKSLMVPDKTSPMPEHFVVLRHQEGDDWDFVVIQHLGAKTEVTATAPPPSDSQRALSAWHSDTFVSGPSWGEFSKEMSRWRISQRGGPGVRRGSAPLRPRSSRTAPEIAGRSWAVKQDTNRQRPHAAPRRRRVDVRDTHPLQLLAGFRDRARGCRRGRRFAQAAGPKSASIPRFTATRSPIGSIRPSRTTARPVGGRDRVPTSPGRGLLDVVRFLQLL